MSANWFRVPKTGYWPNSSKGGEGGVNEDNEKEVPCEEKEDNDDDVDDDDGGMTT